MKNKILSIVFAALTLTAMTSCSNNTGNNAADAVFENIFNRKSVRQFTSEPVSNADIEAMLKAAMEIRGGNRARQA